MRLGIRGRLSSGDRLGPWRRLVVVGGVVVEGGGVGAAVSHVFGEALDAVGVLAFVAEFVAGDEPFGALAGADAST